MFAPMIDKRFVLNRSEIDRRRREVSIKYTSYNIPVGMGC